MKWAFIDYENIGSLGKVELSNYERVIVFLGSKQPRLDFHKSKYDKPISMVVVQLKASQQNNLDFHLAYYLGKLDCEAQPKVSFEVVSNDTGFGPLIAHIKNNGRPCRQLKVASVPADTQKLVQSLKSKPKEKRPQKVASLRNHIASHLGLIGNDVAVQDRLDRLVAESVINISDEAIEYLC